MGQQRYGDDEVGTSAHLLPPTLLIFLQVLVDHLIKY